MSCLPPLKARDSGPVERITQSVNLVQAIDGDPTT